MPYFLRKEYLENFPSFSSKRVAKRMGDGYAAVSAAAAPPGLPHRVVPVGFWARYFQLVSPGHKTALLHNMVNPFPIENSYINAPAIFRDIYQKSAKITPVRQ